MTRCIGTIEGSQKLAERNVLPCCASTNPVNFCFIALTPGLTGSPRRSQKAQGEPQKASGGLRKPQEGSGSTRKPHKTPGATRTAQESPRRFQEEPGRRQEVAGSS